MLPYGKGTPGAILRLVAPALIAIALLAGCEARVAPKITRVWVVSGVEPRFDPDGPPQATRWALERLLSRGLVEEDSSGAIRPAAARSFDVSSDSLLYTFHLRPRLRFTDGTPCRSRDFQRALLAGLGRRDHATRAWLLGAVRGVERVRAGRRLPPIGIETPDDSTLRIRLRFRDRDLPRKLALPGVSAAWSRREGVGWKDARGLGPYRVVRAETRRRLTLARLDRAPAAAAALSGPDTLKVRFEPGTGRARALLRSGRVDLMWPIPPDLLDEDLPAGYRALVRPAVPRRRVLLVMRADVPPTTRLAARHALGHGINRGELLRLLGLVGRDVSGWLSGAGPFDFPALDGDAVRRWLEQGKLGRSFHVVMAYDLDGTAGAIARALQGGWSRLSIYVELRPLRGEDFVQEALRGQSQLLLIDAQSLLDDPAAQLADLVMPLRGPAVGAFRTGWRTREFDRWIAPRRTAPPLPAAEAQERMREELVALPLAGRPWTWVERTSGPAAAFHPHYGPECAGSPSLTH